MQGGRGGYQEVYEEIKNVLWITVVICTGSTSLLYEATTLFNKVKIASNQMPAIWQHICPVYQVCCQCAFKYFLHPLLLCFKDHRGPHTAEAAKQRWNKTWEGHNLEFPNPVFHIAAIVNQWERVHMSALKKIHALLYNTLYNILLGWR